MKAPVAASCKALADQAAVKRFQDAFKAMQSWWCLQEASTTHLQGILGYEEQPLVSTDYVNDKRSSIVDAASTQVSNHSNDSHSCVMPDGTQFKLV